MGYLKMADGGRWPHANQGPVGAPPYDEGGGAAQSRPRDGAYGSLYGGGGLNQSKYGISGGVGGQGTVGYRRGDISAEIGASGSGSLFLPSSDLKALGVSDVMELTTPSINSVKLRVMDALGAGPDEELSFEVVPNRDMTGIDGVYARWRARF